MVEFPDDANDLWEIKMRPEPGFLSVVSSRFQSVVDLCYSFPHFLTLI